MNLLVCRVSLLKNGKETVSVGEGEEDENLNILVSRVSLLKNGKETVSVGEEEEDQTDHVGVRGVTAEEWEGDGVSW